MLAIELTKPFPLPDFVKLGGDDGGGALAGRPGELGIELQRGGTLCMAQAPGDGVQVGTCGRSWVAE